VINAMTLEPEIGRAQSVDSQRDSTRLLATLVLVPSVPMLLASVGALALFYIAPTRFGGLIARLPGESFIRAALFFAPATLFAIVVLAALYAFERPQEASAHTEIRRPDGMSWGSLVRIAARWALVPSALAFLGSVGAWGLSFIAPGRFNDFIEPLPGTRYLQRAVDLAPPLLFLIFLALAVLAAGKSPGESDDQRRSKLLRMGMSLTLTFAVPALVVAALALAFSITDADRFARVLDRLPMEILIRVGLIFAPAVLLALVLLALLVLGREVAEARIPEQEVEPVVQRAAVQRWREQIAAWVLIGGLVLTSAAGLASLVVALYLVVR
jgi:hypothetical protein